jgi:hypothetical protein
MLIVAQNPIAGKSPGAGIKLPCAGKEATGAARAFAGTWLAELDKN